MRLPGEISDNYQVTGVIGSGGMGAVYKAIDHELHRTVAIKIILDTALQQSAVAVRRFYREIELAAQLDHPGIVKIYHIGVAKPYPYLVMEYIDGPSLLDHVDRYCPDLSARLEIIEKIAHALAYAHQCKVIHRDIKPQNILMRGNQPVIIDFGFARTTQVADRLLTRSGEVIGTPGYLSPEQAQGLRREIDHRTDIYSLGAVFYHIFSGRPPVQADNFMEALYILAREEIKPLRVIVADLPPSVENICMKAMAADKNKRYGSAKEFAMDIRRYLQGERALAANFYWRQRIRRWLRWITVSAACLLLLFCLTHWGMAWQARQQQWQRAQEQLTRAGRAKTNFIKAQELDKAYKLWQNLPSFPQQREKLLAIQRQIQQNRYQMAVECWQQGHQQINNAPEYALRLLEDGENLLGNRCRNNLSALAEYRPKIASLITKITLAKKQARASIFFANGLYQHVVASPLPEIRHNPELAWKIACAQYHCQTPEALANFQKIVQILEKRTERRWRHYYLGGLYYQGRIHFDNQRFKQALSCFDRALEAASADKDRKNFGRSSIFMLRRHDWRCSPILPTKYRQKSPTIYTRRARWHRPYPIAKAVPAIFWPKSLIAMTVSSARRWPANACSY